MDVRHAKVAINDTTPVKVFEGRGKVTLRCESHALYGSASISQGNGFRASIGETIKLNVVSDTEIWALVPTGESSPANVFVLAVD